MLQAATPNLVTFDRMIDLMSERPNKAGAGNDAGALPFQVEHLGRAVPDLIR